MLNWKYGIRETAFPFRPKPTQTVRLLPHCFSSIFTGTAGRNILPAVPAPVGKSTRSFPTSFCCLPIICPSAGRTSFTLAVCKGYPARYVSRRSTIQVPLPPLSAPCTGSPGHPGLLVLRRRNFLHLPPAGYILRSEKTPLTGEIGLAGRKKRDWGQGI